MPEMAHYARCDTHYLLYLYDCVRNALLAGGQHMVSKDGIAQGEATAEGVMALRGVLDKSAALCLTLYTETPFDATKAAMRITERFGSQQRPLERRQFSVLQELTVWRDALARRLDESLHFVAPDACLWRLALAMPTSAMRLRSAVNPMPPLLQQNCMEVVDLIARAPQVANGLSEKPGSSATGASSTASAASAPPAAVELSRSTSALSEKTAAGKPHTAPEQQVQAAWPSRSCSKVIPIVHVSSGNLRVNGSENPVKRSASLNEMFESDSGDEALAAATDLDFIAFVPEPSPSAAEAPAQVETQVEDQVQPQAQAAAANVEAEAVAQAVAQAQAELAAAEAEAAMAVDTEVEGSGVATAEAEPQSLRDAYNLPRPATRKKKRKRLAQDMAAEIAKSAAPAATSLETEAASFREALVGAAMVAPAKRMRAAGQPEASAVTDPYAAAPAAPAVEPAAYQDPYGAMADPYTAAELAPPQAVPPAAAAVPTAAAMGQRQNGQPVKKKKKKRPPEPAAPATVMDPYL